MTQPNIKSSREEPTWLPFAHVLIERLRLHHAGRGHLVSDAQSDNQEGDTDDALGEIFQRFNDGQPELEHPVGMPLAPVPARQVLTALRLAVAFGSEDALRAAQDARAVTILADFAIGDLELVTDVLKFCVPNAGWAVVAPPITEGAVSASQALRFAVLIEAAMDLYSSALILCPMGAPLPEHIRQAGLPLWRLPPVSREILMAQLRAGDLGVALTDEAAFRLALPDDARLAKLSTAHVCTALRGPTLPDVSARLAAMTLTDRKDVPRLEEMTGDSPALLTARRLVADLLLWKAGQVAWSELSRSILFYGPPGTGKTWLARAMSAGAGLACVTGSFAEWQAAGHLGDMLREMRKTFAEARSRAPCLLFIDEIDAVGSRASRDPHNSNYRTQVINAFLGEMNAIALHEGVIVVGACNFIDRIDPAVLRAGRFDLKIKVPLPDAAGLLALLRRHLRDEIADEDLTALARASVGCSPAEIDAAIRGARSDARHAGTGLSVAMLYAQLDIDMANDTPARIWRVAVHEAGHAIVGAALGLGRITSLKITPTGGEILRSPVRSESLLTDLEAEIAYSLAGRAAERLVLGSISAGAGGPATSDLAKATECALGIETVYGLGSEGPVWHDAPEALMLQNAHLRGRVRQRIERAEKRAGVILAQHRAMLEGLARALWQERSLNSDQIAAHLRDIREVTASAMAEGNRQDPEQADIMHSESR
ncbi:ATP-dependent zinc metalloprotease FtsH [Roseovarius mucosus]|uniref:ATP-dependent zinc metalloprotease FtsH n=1 Tax=Roseovarius mucosus TaxID=215743 RepID=A0A1V0RM99_9RHOB|nr:AAA family ATPase [Roseovarius mucosus]ARE82884.1 ATP-dependent zinc metalloprotease FtsH [Roseovarius mucosus]